jgi:hypothetical protein
VALAVVYKTTAIRVRIECDHHGLLVSLEGNAGHDEDTAVTPMRDDPTMANGPVPELNIDVRSELWDTFNEIGHDVVFAWIDQTALRTGPGEALQRELDAWLTAKKREFERVPRKSSFVDELNRRLRSST